VRRAFYRRGATATRPRQLHGGSSMAQPVLQNMSQNGLWRLWVKRKQLSV
jgi:hypothetical protein